MRAIRLPQATAGDVVGATAAMLVALPSAIALGVTIFFPLGPSHVAHGALAGIIGVVALGLVAPAAGSTRLLVSAPCAPAAAVLAAFALQYAGSGADPADAALLFFLLAASAGLLQIAFGALRLGQLIRYMPYPVVSGFLSGVGLYIVACHVPKFLGAPPHVGFWQALATPACWRWQAVAVGAVTLATMAGAQRLTRSLPAPIVGLLAGAAAYLVLGAADPRLLELRDNQLVIGPIGGPHGGLLGALAGYWRSLAHLRPAHLQAVAGPAVTLAVLLSIDTLKTCVVIDQIMRTRHDSNRELRAQGLANIVAAIAGGIPGAGSMGPTLISISSGARHRVSGILAGALALAAFLVLGRLIAWVPVAALAAVLIVLGLRMMDWRSLALLRQRATMHDFAVIVAVVVTALSVSLIAASAVGIVLAVALFIREQVGVTIVRRKVDGNEIFSKRVRTQAEMAVLLREGARAVVVELQDSLFFGTANQLHVALEQELKRRDFVILDMRRIQAVDVTGARALDQIRDIVAERGGLLLLSQLPQTLPSGRDIEQYLDQVGLVRPESSVRVFATLDQALEWVEDQLIAAALPARDVERPLELHELELLRHHRQETLAALEGCMEKRSYRAGERIFGRGEAGDQLYIIRSGSVRIMLPISAKLEHHLGTFGRGAVFGEMAFIDGEARSADAWAAADSELFVLSRAAFDQVASQHRKLGLNLMKGLASVLASRLRYTSAELRALQS